MKVLGISCSPRRNGNTQALVEEALRAAAEMGAETELYPAGQKRIAPCDACDFCHGTGLCQIDDDMQELYVKLREADGIIFGSPVYFWYPSAQAKAVIDRMYMLRRSTRELAGKVAGAVVVAESRGESAAMGAFLGTFVQHWMVSAALMSAVADKPGEVLGNAAAMEEARRVGRTVVAVARYREK